MTVLIPLSSRISIYPTSSNKILSYSDMAATSDQNNVDFLLTDNADRAKFRDHFVGHEAETHTKRWDDLWVQGFLPWDRGVPSPALVDTLTERQDLLPKPIGDDGKRRKVLIPGCGRGYDVLLLSSFGYDAYGLDASENALEACKVLESENRPEYAAKDESIGKGKVKWVAADFFKDDWFESIDGGFGNGFDLIYDYTVSAFSFVTALASY